MARTGGICTFIMIGAVILAMLFSIVAQGTPVLAVIGLIFNLVAFVLWFVVMIALKVNFAQNGFPRGGGVIWSTIALTVLLIIVGIAGGIAVGMEMSRSTATSDPTEMMKEMLRAFGIWGVVLGLMVIALQFCFLLLGIRLNEYGAIAGGVWKGAGIVLIIATCLGMLITLLYVLTVLTQGWGLLIVAGILGLIGLLLWGVVWLLIGIGFMGDANRMAMAGEPARR